MIGKFTQRNRNRPVTGIMNGDGSKGAWGVCSNDNAHIRLKANALLCMSVH